MSFKTTVARAIECANVIRVNDHEIDEFFREGQEQVLGCSGVQQFKFVDADTKEVEVDDDGQCMVDGYSREDTGDLPWNQAELFLELWKTRPINETDFK